MNSVILLRKWKKEYQKRVRYLTFNIIYLRYSINHFLSFNKMLFKLKLLGTLCVFISKPLNFNNI